MDPKARSSPPGLKVTIKSSSAGDRHSPAVTIQSFVDSKEAGSRVNNSGFKPGLNHNKTSPSGGSPGKLAHKINERFITDPGAAQRVDERKRSGDSSGGMMARRKLGKFFPFH